MSSFLIILNILEGAACVTGFLYWQKVKVNYWRWFPVYLFAIVSTELAGEYSLHIKKDLHLNAAIYNYWGIPIQFFFFYWIFYQFFRQTSTNRWPLYATVIYLICWLSDIFLWPDIFYVNKVKQLFDSFSYTIGNILLLILLLLFFIQFSKSDAILNYRKSMMFWVCLGLMIFYLGSMPFYGIRTTLYYQYPEIFYPYWYIQFVLSYIMYVLFIVSFIWGKPK